jgi:RNA polymerase sigma-70 factor (ECF subfamily)
MEAINNQIHRVESSDASDEALVRAIAAGDRSALKILYLRHQARVCRFLLRFVDGESAEEIANEVFIEVWRKADRFEGKSKAATWLLGIARHKAMSQVRRRPELQLDEAVAAKLADPGDSPATAADKQDCRIVVQQCIARLTPQHREVIDLIYYQEKKIDEAARFLHVPVNTIKTRMFYARSRMAKLLAEAGVDQAWAAA